MKRFSTLLALISVVAFALTLILVSCKSPVSSSPDPVSVTYDGNGADSGSVPIDTTNYLAGQTVTVAENSGNLVRAGYSFTGWNTAPDGSGTGYAPGATFAMGSANVTLYAQWTKLPTYVVTYDGNYSTGGSVPSDTTNYLAGQTVTVAENSGNLVWFGYSFSGWNTAPDGSGTGYAPGTTFAMGSTNVSLYAMWTNAQLLTVSVTYDISYSLLSFSQTSVEVAKGSVADFSTTNATLASSGTNWIWRLDGVTLTGQTANSLQLDTTGMATGTYNIDVFVKYQGVMYSANLALTVTN